MKKKKCDQGMLNEKGITLIALVITVIILLILAGAAVSIGLNGGDVFSRANQAKTEWNAKVEEEDRKINEVWSMANKNPKVDNREGIIVNHNGINVDISKIPENEIATYYGDYVVNYTTGGTYQLYYVDTDGKYGETGRIYIQNTTISRRKGWK